MNVAPPLQDSCQLVRHRSQHWVVSSDVMNPTVGLFILLAINDEIVRMRQEWLVLRRTRFLDNSTHREQLRVSRTRRRERVTLTQSLFSLLLAEGALCSAYVCSVREIDSSLLVGELRAETGDVAQLKAALFLRKNLVYHVLVFIRIRHFHFIDNFVLRGVVNERIGKF